MSFRFLLTAAALLAAQPACAAETSLAPAGEWRIEYLPNTCQIYRRFGTGKDSVMLVAEKFAPMTLMSLTLVGERLDLGKGGASKHQVQQRIPVRFGSETVVRAEDAFVTTTAGSPRKTALWWVAANLASAAKVAEKAAMKTPISRGRPPVQPAAERAAEAKAARTDLAAADRIVIGAKGRGLTLLTGSLLEVNDKLDQCVEAQLPIWGGDPLVQAKIVREPFMGDVRGILSEKDYPMDQLNDGLSSTVIARLRIDETGKVTSCTPVPHVQVKAFDSNVCNAYMLRGRYEPAELEDGTKVATIQRLTIRFVIPD